ncbi:MAG: hypothetical protein ACRDRA_05260 [Pseudonocardiaceae bacterium]
MVPHIPHIPHIPGPICLLALTTALMIFGTLAILGFRRRAMD